MSTKYRTLLEQLQDKSCKPRMETRGDFVSFDRQIDYMIECDGGGGDWENALITSVGFEEDTNTLTITQKGGNIQSVVLNIPSILEWLDF